MVNFIANLQNYPRAILTVMIAMITAGILAYTNLPKEAQPDIDVPVFYISISQPGISAQDADLLLVRPMETALQGLEGLKRITSIASESHAGIILEFDISFDKEKVLSDIRDKVDQGRSDLPEDALEPSINETNFSLLPTIAVALSGNVPERVLIKHAKQLEAALDNLPQVLSADISGEREQFLEINIDNARIESYRFSQQDIFNAIRGNNQLVAAGFLDQGDGRFNIKVPGLVQNANDLLNLPVRVVGDTVVTLKDVASVKQSFKDATAYTRVNGKPAVAINVTKRLGENIIDTNSEVRKTVEQVAKNWPPIIDINFMLDESKRIIEIQSSLESSILTAIALVMILVVAIMGLRTALLIGFAIPASFMIGFMLVAILGMSVNMMVMFGLVLTVGMLVDGAIVMVEYADRRLNEGYSAEDAYKEAISRMFLPIFSSTATTLAAFIPMLLWPGVSGEFMSYLPIMVIIVLSSAFLTAMVFLPAAGILSYNIVSYFVHRIIGKKRKQIARHEIQVLRGDKSFNEKIISGPMKLYIGLLKILSKHMIMPIVLLILIIGAGFGIVAYFSSNNQGIEFFVDEEPDVAIIFVRARGNLSADAKRDLTLEVENEILQVEGISTIYTEIGDSGQGNVLTSSQDKPNDSIAQITIELKDYDKRAKASTMFDEIRRRTSDLAGLIIEIKKREGGPPSGKDIRLEIAAEKYEQLTSITAIVRNYVQHQLGDVRDVEDSRPLPGIEWEVEVNRTEAGRYGTNIAEVGTMVQTITNGILVSKYRPDDSDEELDIRLRLPKDERNFDNLDRMKISTPKGLVPMKNFITRSARPQISSYTRVDGYYVMDVKANIIKPSEEQSKSADGEVITPDVKISQLQSWLDSQEWPEGIRFTFRGADEDQKEVQEFMPIAGLIAIFTIFIILVTQFNNFYQTFLTLSTVMMSVFGVLLGMALTGQKFSVIMTSTGIVALVGIVVNNAIVLIDTYNEFRKDGALPRDAMLATCSQRFRPVMLTTITTIAGLIPMATEMSFDFFSPMITIGSITSVWWVQLSTAIISGLAFSTILTLIVIPAMLVLPSLILKLAGDKEKAQTKDEPDLNKDHIKEDYALEN